MSTTDIAPVKRRLATVLGTSDGVSDFVGRLFGTRGTLVHGDSASVSSDDLDRVEALADSLDRSSRRRKSRRRPVPPADPVVVKGQLNKRAGDLTSLLLHTPNDVARTLAES